MKKFFSQVLGLIVMTSMQAANTEVARLTLSGQGGTESSYVTLRVNPDVNETSAYFGATDEIGQVIIYATEGAEKYSAYTANQIINLPIEIITNRRDAVDQHYTITFKVPTLTVGLKLKDLKTGSEVDIVDKGTYEFDVNTTLHPDFVAGTNYVVKDRFVINYTYVIMKGDFSAPGNDWAYTSNFIHEGTTSSLELELAADTWYHFQIEENGAIGANGSSFDSNHASYVIPTTSWDSQLTLHTDLEGKYQFIWTYATQNLEIIFPAPTAIDNVEAGVQAQKFVENGQIYIRRGNEVFNLQGQEVK